MNRRRPLRRADTEVIRLLSRIGMGYLARSEVGHRPISRRHTMANAERRRVLFVEDEQALQISYERFFRPRFEMNFAGTGAEAMAQLESEAPDVLVLDMRLPDTDGIELLRKIRSLHPDLPVIVTTAYLSIEPQLQVLDLGYSGYIVKPFDLDDLGSAIDAAG